MFLDRFPWFSFLIQAPQALYTLTGYGVVLGGVMGLITDSFWATTKLALGKSVTIVGPPPADPVGRAAARAAGGPWHYTVHQGMSAEDHFLTLIGDVFMFRALVGVTPVALLDTRLETALAATIPIRWPWSEETIRGLEANGVDPLPELAALQPVTFGQAYAVTTEHLPEWLELIKRDLPPRNYTTALFAAISEVGQEFYDWLNGTRGTLRPLFDPEELALARTFELQTFPSGDVSGAALAGWVVRAGQLAFSAGREFPSIADYRQAAIEVLGGWSGE